VRINYQISSNVVQVTIHPAELIFFIDILSNKRSKFLGILHHAWDLYRARPVHIVETLGVYQLLEVSFFQLRLTVDDFIEGWFHTASVALLGHQVKLIALADCLRAHQNTRIRVRESISSLGEKLERCILVKKHIRKTDLRVFF